MTDLGGMMTIAYLMAGVLFIRQLDGDGDTGKTDRRGDDGSRQDF